VVFCVKGDETSGYMKDGNVCKCYSKHHILKMYWRIEVLIQVFLIPALDGGKLSASGSGH